MARLTEFLRAQLRAAWAAKLMLVLAFGIGMAVAWAAIDHRYRDKIAEYEATIISLSNDIALAYDLTRDNPRRPAGK